MKKNACMVLIFLLAMFLALPVKNAFAGSLTVEVRQINPDSAVQKVVCDKRSCDLPFVINAGTAAQQSVIMHVNNYQGGGMLLSFVSPGKILLVSDMGAKNSYSSGYSKPLLSSKPATYKITLYPQGTTFPPVAIANLEITASETGMEAEEAFIKAQMAEKQEDYPEGSELALRKSIAEQFKDLFMHKKFNEINKISEHYRKTEERTPSGVWKLTPFYRGAGLLHDKKKDDEKQRSELFAIAQEWIDKDPSPAAYIIDARLYYNLAWDIRGHGYANTVSKEQWMGFSTNLHKAHQILEESKVISSVDPEWYANMISLSRDEQWPAADTEALYTEAMTKFPYYYEIYFSILAGLQPKWGGSYKLIEEFAKSAVEHTKEKEGNSLYAKIYWNFTQIACCTNNDVFGDTLLNWNEMKEGIKDVLARYPDQWNINNFAYFACVAKDKEETNFLMSQITTPEPKAWNNDFAFYTRCKAEK